MSNRYTFPTSAFHALKSDFTESMNRTFHSKIRIARHWRLYPVAFFSFLLLECLNISCMLFPATTMNFSAFESIITVISKIPVLCAYVLNYKRIICVLKRINHLKVITTGFRALPHNPSVLCIQYPPPFVMIVLIEELSHEFRRNSF